MVLIDGKKIAERIKDEIVGDIINLKGARPNLAIILVGEREDSKIYVTLKERQAKLVGIDTHLYKCDADMKETELISMIDFLNSDVSIDGILLQLPLPDGFDADKAVERILPEKDIDGFHPRNLEKFMASCGNTFTPPLVGVILEALKEIEFDPEDKKAAILVNSDLLGNAIKHALECQGVRASIYHQDEPVLALKTSRADLLITAFGKPRFLNKDYVKQDAVIIDIGISRLPDGKVTGDVDAESVKDNAGYLTPVPGGVGPVTIAMALKNTLRLYQDKN